MRGDLDVWTSVPQNVISESEWEDFRMTYDGGDDQTPVAQRWQKIVIVSCAVWREHGTAGKWIRDLPPRQGEFIEGIALLLLLVCPSFLDAVGRFPGSIYDTPILQAKLLDRWFLRFSTVCGFKLWAEKADWEFDFRHYIGTRRMQQYGTMRINWGGKGAWGWG